MRLLVNHIYHEILTYSFNYIASSIILSIKRGIKLGNVGKSSKHSILL